MELSSSLFSPMDPETRRRQALASVYDFLLKLAEEKKNSENLKASDPKKESKSAPLQKNIPS